MSMFIFLRFLTARRLFCADYFISISIILGCQSTFCIGPLLLMQTACRRPLAREADRMFVELLSITLSGTKTATADALKAVVSVIDANPSLMSRKVRGHAY